MTATAIDGAGLLKAIIDDPADDLPRLAYADWREENGDDARAEFIRVQVELYRLEESVHDRVVSHLSLRGDETPAPGCECRPCSLRRRERCAWRAKDRLGERFAIPPAEEPGMGMPDTLYSSAPHPSRIVWRRGFPHTVRCPIAAWLEHGKALAAAHPLERVELSDKSPARADRIPPGGNAPPDGDASSDLWRWRIGPERHALGGLRWFLPHRIGRLLRGFARKCSSTGVLYATVEAATAALSCALLAWARATPAA